MAESEVIKILENKDYELWNGDCLELMNLKGEFYKMNKK